MSLVAPYRVSLNPASTAVILTDSNNITKFLQRNSFLPSQIGTDTVGLTFIINGRSESITAPFGDWQDVVGDPLGATQYDTLVALSNLMGFNVGGGGGAVTSVNGQTGAAIIGLNSVLLAGSSSTTRALFNGIPYVAANEIPVFLDETSTIADFVAGATHYYIGNANITYDYDLLPYPLPVPVSGFNFVNLSVFDAFFTSNFGNYSYLLKPTQSLQDIQIIDNGYWEFQATVYFDNIYNLQQVTDKGAITTNAPIVRNNPDIYRTRYSILGQDVQRDDLGFRVSYYENAITKSTNSNSKSWALQFPDLTANANNSSFVVDVRPNVSGTVAYLEDISNVPTANEFIVTSTTPYVATDNIKNIYVNPVATIATANITLPPNPTNSQKVTVAVGGAITSGTVVTTLTVLGTVGKDILSGDAGNPASLVVPANSADTFTFQYSSQLSKWVIL